MQIPQMLKESYDRDVSLSAYTSYVVNKTEDYISANRFVFFPGFTDHSSSHITQTLQTAVEILTPQASDIIKPKDCSIIVVAACLHDLGMHISRDGFIALVTTNDRWTGTRFFEDKPWPALWADFMQEARRYDGKKLESIFGEHYEPVEEPNFASLMWNDVDYLLVGEFIRQHHPRLAFDIALFGMPGKDGASISICHNDSENTRTLSEIAGLVARSHGQPLRASSEYFLNRFGNYVDPRGCLPVFAMVLLRIADHFQIQASRAPLARTQVETLTSPYSTNEWRMHQSVQDVTRSDADPESVSVFASPQHVEIFMRLRNWQISLQKELDISWAVLGEVYGRHSDAGYHQLGLRVRRVKSNLDNNQSFANSVDYIPDHISFETAGSDLLKLLVSPLYGGDVSVGVRELLQNAVDAVKERSDLRSFTPSKSTAEPFSVKARIVLDERDRPIQLEIVDTGCGMNLATLKNYFLRAGASFRRSDEWKKSHENSRGISRIARGGRFGVGALAAFLLGDEIEVITRHHSSSLGLAFRAKIDDASINVTKVSAAIGTTVRVALSEEAKKDLSRKPQRDRIMYYGDNMGFYFQRTPEITRMYGEVEVRLDPSLYIPDDNDKAVPGWRRLIDKNFTLFVRNTDNSLFCNGIFVHRLYNRSHLLTFDFFRIPGLSVVDRKGLFPLNLQRNGLADKLLPFEPILSNALFEEYVIHSLRNTFRQKHRPVLDVKSYVSQVFERKTIGSWIYTKFGLIPNNYGLLSHLKLTHLIVLHGFVNFEMIEAVHFDMIPEGIAVAIANEDLFIAPGNMPKGIFAAFCGLPSPHLENHVTGLKPKGFRSYFSKGLIKLLQMSSPGKALSKLIRKVDKVDSPYGFFASPGSNKDSLNLALSYATKQDTNDNWLISEIELQYSSEKPAGLSFPSEAFCALLPDSAIPFDIKKREHFALMFSSEYPDSALVVSEVERRSKTIAFKDDEDETEVDEASGAAPIEDS